MRSVRSHVLKFDRGITAPLVFRVFWISILHLTLTNAHANDDSVIAVPTNDAAFFDDKVQPILKRRCYECHGPESDGKAGLRVDSLRDLVVGGESGPAIVPGHPEKSLLIDVIHYGDIYQMPPSGKMPAGEIEVLEGWVKLGAPWPGQSLKNESVRAEGKTNQYSVDDRNHWAFKRPDHTIDLPEVVDRSWPTASIDYFVLSKLEEAGLTPASPADKRMLIRRATFDLHGLPPTPQEMEAFLTDDSSSAFKRVVDRLLDSPRYGERWGNHWLDVARYADSNGGDQNRIHAHAYRYRDYVINAFNENVPYDQFILEQLAGDLLTPKDQSHRNQLLSATGFLTVGPKPLLKDDSALSEMDVVDEQIQTVSGALMGLTLGCCRCHDHKFDPLPMSDYYALAGILKSTRTIERYDMRIHRSWTEKAIGSEKIDTRHRELKRQFDQYNDMRRLSNKGEGYDEYKKMADAVRARLARIPVVMCVREGEVGDCPIHLRGNPQTLGETVPRGFPAILRGTKQFSIDPSQSGRLELARWLVSPDHPLTSRVMVNRLWKWHFGEGIVRSTDNFGRLGQLPTNQPLLDWLANQFVTSGWSIREMHRELMLSSTYQMGGQHNAKATHSDPDNRLHWRFSPRRMSVEEIRDSMLMVSGTLIDKRGGPALPANLNYLLVDKAPKTRRVVEAAYNSKRRTVYLPVIRSGLAEMFKVFDFAGRAVVTGSRPTTTVAPQALFMMNSEFMWNVSQSAGRMALQSASDDGRRLEHLYLQALGRPPSDSEVNRAVRFLEEYKIQSSEIDAWQALCRVLFSSNEFVYVQ